MELFDSVTAGVETGSSSIHDNSVSSAEGRAGGWLTTQRSTLSCHHQSSALSHNCVERDAQQRPEGGNRDKASSQTSTMSER